MRASNVRVFVSPVGGRKKFNHGKPIVESNLPNLRKMKLPVETLDCYQITEDVVQKHFGRIEGVKIRLVHGFGMYKGDSEPSTDAHVQIEQNDQKSKRKLIQETARMGEELDQHAVYLVDYDTSIFPSGHSNWGDLRGYQSLQPIASIKLKRAIDQKKLNRLIQKVGGEGVTLSGEGNIVTILGTYEQNNSMNNAFKTKDVILKLGKILKHKDLCNKVIIKECSFIGIGDSMGCGNTILYESAKNIGRSKLGL